MSIYILFVSPFVAQSTSPVDRRRRRQLCPVLATLAHAGGHIAGVFYANVANELFEVDLWLIGSLIGDVSFAPHLVRQYLGASTFAGVADCIVDSAHLFTSTSFRPEFA